MHTILLNLCQQIFTSFVVVAIAYIQQKVPYVFPIVGGRKVEHLHANLEALEIALSEEQVAYLDNVIPWSKGFPYNYFVSPSTFGIF